MVAVMFLRVILKINYNVYRLLVCWLYQKSEFGQIDVMQVACGNFRLNGQRFVAGCHLTSLYMERGKVI
jgi:hypothetical protein